MPDNSRILSLLYSESGHLPPRFGTNTMLRSAIWLLRHVPHRGKLLEWRHVIGPGKGRPTPLAADGVAGVLAGIYGRPAKASSRGTPTPRRQAPGYSLPLFTSCAHEARSSMSSLPRHIPYVVVSGPCGRGRHHRLVTGLG